MYPMGDRILRLVGWIVYLLMRLFALLWIVGSFLAYLVNGQGLWKLVAFAQPFSGLLLPFVGRGQLFGVTVHSFVWWKIFALFVTTLMLSTHGGPLQAVVLYKRGDNTRWMSLTRLRGVLLKALEEHPEGMTAAVAAALVLGDRTADETHSIKNQLEWLARRGFAEMQEYWPDADYTGLQPLRGAWDEGPAYLRSSHAQRALQARARLSTIEPFGTYEGTLSLAEEGIRFVGRIIEDNPPGLDAVFGTPDPSYDLRLPWGAIEGTRHTRGEENENRLDFNLPIVGGLLSLRAWPVQQDLARWLAELESRALAPKSSAASQQLTDSEADLDRFVSEPPRLDHPGTAVPTIESHPQAGTEGPAPSVHAVPESGRGGLSLEPSEKAALPQEATRTSTAPAAKTSSSRRHTTTRRRPASTDGWVIVVCRSEASYERISRLFRHDRVGGVRHLTGVHELLTYESIDVSLWVFAEDYSDLAAYDAACVIQQHSPMTPIVMIREPAWDGDVLQAMRAGIRDVVADGSEDSIRAMVARVLSNATTKSE